jgi:hypothetical protein
MRRVQIRGEGEGHVTAKGGGHAHLVTGVGQSFQIVSEMNHNDGHR